MGHFHDVAADLRQPTRDLRRAIPETWAGFAELHRSAMAEGVLPTRIKELMALVIGVSEHCDGCVAYHARAAAAAGASRDEVAEALGVALLMGGGPASVWTPRALSAFDEFAAPTDDGAAPAEGST
ncbi:MAG: carboxymuconolactone decarboxylase family protein [Acidimicrobiales bacterium]